MHLPAVACTPLPPTCSDMHPHAVVERSGLALFNIQTQKYCRHTGVQVSIGLVELVEHHHHVGDLVRDHEQVVGVGDGGGWVLVGQLRSEKRTQ